MHIIIHYAEIGTKGRNRGFFEKKLVENIRLALGKGYQVKRLYGRIVVESGKSDEKKIKNILENIPGIANFSFSVKTKLSMADMKNKALQVAKQNKGKKKTFRIEAKRSNKNFPYNSLRINEMLAGDIIKKCRLKVNLTEPELTIYAEVGEKNAFLHAEKIQGIGGLPVGTSGKLVCLLSGGIDSPVAAYSMMRRGCKVVFVHFCQKLPLSLSRLTHRSASSSLKVASSPKENISKIEKIVKELSKFQHSSRLYMIPFQKSQREIIKCVPAKYRMIAYRRAMLRIAEQILEKENAKGFVTGDNLGQVASQTLENMAVIHKSTGYPVFAPLIGNDKNEIIRVAEKIGTFRLSIIPYPDCCSYMIAEHPATKSDLKTIQNLEKKMRMSKIIKDAIKNKEVVKV